MASAPVRFCKPCELEPIFSLERKPRVFVLRNHHDRGKSAPQAKIFTEFHGEYAENVKKIL